MYECCWRWLLAAPPPVDISHSYQTARRQTAVPVKPSRLYMTNIAWLARSSRVWSLRLAALRVTGDKSTIHPVWKCPITPCYTVKHTGAQHVTWDTSRSPPLLHESLTCQLRDISARWQPVTAAKLLSHSVSAWCFLPFFHFLPNHIGFSLWLNLLCFSPQVTGVW